MKPPERYVAVAEVARPHGVQGELRLKLYNADSDLLTGRPKVRLAPAEGAEREVSISSARATQGALLVRFSGVDDRNAAEALRGAKILVRRDAFPPLEEGEFYTCDVEGARAVLRSGEDVGVVLGIEKYPTCDVLVVDRGAGRKIEVPLIDAYIGAVDVEREVVELVTIDGLD